MPRRPKFRTNRRRRYKPRRAIGMRKAGVMRSMASIPRVYKFKRSGNVAGLNFLWQIAAQNPTYTPNFADIPNYTEFVALFDEYKINKIVLHFECLFSGRDMNQTNATGGGTALLGSLKRVRCIHDYNDSTALANENEAYEYANLKSYAVGKSFSITLVPKVLTMTYKTAVTTGYQCVRPKFIPMADSTVPHYGLKFFLGQQTSDIADANLGKQLYNCRADYYFMCKNVK